jgi:Family of unknown function (DUF6527)
MISLSPSIGLGKLPRRSHYWIRQSRVDWCVDMTATPIGRTVRARGLMVEIHRESVVFGVEAWDGDSQDRRWHAIGAASSMWWGSRSGSEQGSSPLSVEKVTDVRCEPETDHIKMADLIRAVRRKTATLSWIGTRIGIRKTSHFTRASDRISVSPRGSASQARN